MAHVSPIGLKSNSLGVYRQGLLDSRDLKLGIETADDVRIQRSALLHHRAEGRRRNGYLVGPWLEIGKYVVSAIVRSGLLCDPGSSIHRLDFGGRHRGGGGIGHRSGKSSVEDLSRRQGEERNHHQAGEES
jgi:hypothetical protein